MVKIFKLLYLISSISAEKKFRIKTYRVTVNVQDRYVRSEVAVQVKNNLMTTEKYEFGVKLDEEEFISSLTMRIGKHNKCEFNNCFLEGLKLPKNCHFFQGSAR